LPSRRTRTARRAVSANLASDNKRIFSDFSLRNISVMAESKEETAGMALPQKPESTPDLLQGDGAKRDMARMPLPSRQPARRPPSMTALPPSGAASPIPHPLLKLAGVSGQPSSTTYPAETIVPPASIIFAASSSISVFDSIPRWFCWGLLGISVLIFLIQIWNYALS
jgi:hypothetical protein